MMPTEEETRAEAELFRYARSEVERAAMRWSYARFEDFYEGMDAFIAGAEWERGRYQELIEALNEPAFVKVRLDNVDGSRNLHAIVTMSDRLAAAVRSLREEGGAE